MTHIAMLAVSDGDAAIKFHPAAFAAELCWRLDAGGHVVAGVSTDGAKFFLAREAPDSGTRSPSPAGFTTVRIELLLDDPIAIHQQAVAAGAIEGNQSLSTSTKHLAGTNQTNASRPRG